VDLCPITGRRVLVLYLPGKGGTMFASRHASGLAYRSQRASPEDRAIERSLKARTKLGVADQNMLDMPYCAASLMLAQLLRKHGLGAVVLPHTAGSRAAIGALDGSGVWCACPSWN
jgi:hypothetical protein